MLVLPVLVLAGCGDGDDQSSSPTTSGRSETSEASGAISLQSPAFAFEAAIPDKYSRDNGNLSPPLIWSVTAEGAVELVLVMDDPDAGGDGFTHWMVAGIDAATTGTGEGAVPAGAVEGENDFGDNGYGGPDPPGGDRHRYAFELVALDAPTGLEEGFSRDDLDRALEGHVLARAEYAGFFAQSS